MKAILENWRGYLLKETPRYDASFQLYVDLDGVLINFEGGVVDAINGDIEDPSRVSLEHRPAFDKMIGKISDVRDYAQIVRSDISRKKAERGDVGNAVRDYMYRRFQDDVKFWAGLWNYVKGSTPPPIILTSPMKGDPKGGDHKGKEEWVKEHLGDHVRVIVERDKWKYAVAEDGTGNILIDDTENKVVPWRERGGIAIHHVSVSRTIEEYEENRVRLNDERRGVSNQ
jgi:hypothetical protein